MPETASASRRAVLPSLMAVVVFAQLFIAHRYFGFLTGDEVEVLDEAFHRALHHPFTPWGIRNLFVPDFVVAPMVWLASRPGLDTARVIEIAALPFILLTAITTGLVHRLALRWSDGDRRAAMLAALLFSLHWIPLGFGATVYPRTLATACVVGAALIAATAPVAAGALVGLAFADRFSEIVFLLPVAYLAGRRAPRVVAGAAISIALTVGLYDWHTYGTAFSSIVSFARITLFAPDFASRVKYQGPLWYFANILRWLAPTMLPLLWMARSREDPSSTTVAAKPRSGIAMGLFILVPLLALSLVRHKELRYLQTTIPFIAIAAAIGTSQLWERRRTVAVTLLSISLAWNLWGIRFVARKSMPAVMAARHLAADPTVHTAAFEQLWAYGDRLYLGHIDAIDLDPQLSQFSDALGRADAVTLWESDLDRPSVVQALKANGFHAALTFHDGPAKAVVLFRK